MPTPSVINQYRYSDAINQRVWDSNYFFDDFTVQPISAAVGGGAATGADGDHNALYTRFGAYEYFSIGINTAFAPTLDTFGMNLVQTVTAGVGTELLISSANLALIGVSPASFITGESNPFFFRCQFQVTDASGINPLIIGFRKVQAANDDFTMYTDFAVIGINDVLDPNAIYTVTQTSAGPVFSAVDTTQTWADGEAHFLAVFVDSLGNVTFQLDGQTPTVTQTFQFVDGLEVIPFIQQIQAVDTTTNVSIDWLECGFQS